MKCSIFQRELEHANAPALLTGELRTHAAACHDCAAHWQQRAGLQSLLCELDEVAPPADFDARLRARLARRETEDVGFFGYARRGMFTPLAASCASLSLAALMLFAAWHGDFFTERFSEHRTTGEGTHAINNGGEPADAMLANVNPVSAPESKPPLTGKRIENDANDFHRVARGSTRNVPDVRRDGSMNVSRTQTAGARRRGVESSVNDGAITADGTGAPGVVERVTRDDAAASRALARETSVPQMWLGAQGQAVAGIEEKNLVQVGWRPEAARQLLTKQEGVLLTVVPPFTPAALADLRPGDVVTHIGEQTVRNNDEFGKLLADAGANADVQLTVERAEQSSQRVNVRLSEPFDPTGDAGRAAQQARLAAVGDSLAKLLLPLGLELVTAPAKLRAEPGAQDGLLVVSLRTNGIAAVSNLKPGDIIERANGKLLTEIDAATLASTGKPEATFDLIRAGQRISVTMEIPAQTGDR